MTYHNYLSIVVPIFNEEENLFLFFDELFNVMKSNYDNFEIIFINDGSSDNSQKILKDI